MGAIKDTKGRLIGRIEDHGNETAAYDIKGRLVGRYKKAEDMTLDSQGRTVTRAGDALSDLLIRKK
jgi:YD repeat-containing protein